MTIQEAIERIKYRIYTATAVAGNGIDGNAFEDLEMAIEALEKQTPKKVTIQLFEELKQYKYLEEQGLVLRLPCKVGDTVYRIVPNTYRHVQAMTVETFLFDGENLMFKNNYGLVHSCKEIGKTIFFLEKEAQSEAEEKLRELEEK